MTYRTGALALLCALSFALSFALVFAPAREARADDPPRLDIGPPLYDEQRPTGRPVAPTAPRPPADARSVVACSFDQPVCVHAPATAAPEASMWTLRYAERALAAFAALGLPRPLTDGDLGGGPAYDIYLSPTATEPSTTIDLTSRAGGFDSYSAFTVMPPPPPRDTCVTASAVARALAHAIVLRFDAGVEDGAAAMATSYLASLGAGCDLVELEAVDDFQRAPWRSLTSGAPDAPSGSLLFPLYLDERWGTGAPGGVIASLLAVAGQRTPQGALSWNNEPDLFDALRSNMKARESSLDELLLDFAVARAFTGDRDDGALLPSTGHLGAFGRVAFEWSIPYDTLPRRLAPARPIEATGATYLWLDLKDAPLGHDLTVVFEWELPSLFRWALVKVDPRGASVGRVDVAGIYGDKRAEKTLIKLDGLAGLLVVGVNVGSIDRGHPFDPDEEPLMPHSYTATFYK